MLWLAIILGLIEGATEFLPVSSTGHLILFGDILGFQGPSGKTFEITIQLGAVLSVCWIFWDRIAHTITGTLRGSAEDKRFALNVIIAFIPTVVAGLLFGSFIKEQLFNPFTVSIALIIGGFAILAIEYAPIKTPVGRMEALTPLLALKIGLCQCLALIPGTSRSGATIMGARLLGVERRAATEFSFFLAIPTMFAATFYDLFKHRHELSFDDIGLIAVGFVVAFLSAILAVRFLIRYISAHTFAPFAYYRIALGALMLYLL